MTVAITGASGQLGRLAVQAMKERGIENIVGLVRSPEKIEDLGIEARAFDYKNPGALAEALDGVDTLVLISSSDFDDRAGQHINVINAAKAAGVERLVYTSILKGTDSPLLIAEDHKKTEAAIAASGIPATILRNGWYTENWTAALQGALQAGAVIGSAGDGQVTPAARADYAEAIAVVAGSDEHKGKVYELAGDQAFTLSEYAAEVSAQTGRDVPYNDLPQEAYAKVLTDIGFPQAFGTLVSDADYQASKGALFDDSGTLSRLIGRPTTALSEAVRAAL